MARKPPQTPQDRHAPAKPAGPVHIEIEGQPDESSVVGARQLTPEITSLMDSLGEVDTESDLIENTVCFELASGQIHPGHDVPRVPYGNPNRIGLEGSSTDPIIHAMEIKSNWLVEWAIKEGLFKVDCWRSVRVFSLDPSISTAFEQGHFYLRGDAKAAIATGDKISSERSFDYSSIIMDDNKNRYSLALYNGEFRLYYSPIVKNPTDEDVKLSPAERWSLLEAFAVKSRGKGVASFGKKLFPELLEQPVLPGPTQSLPSPSHIERPRWAEREADDTPITFVKKHYGVWREDGTWDRNGLTRADLRYDKQLYHALLAHERRHPEDSLGLPTRSEAAGEWVERVLNGEEAPQTALEKDKFAAAVRRRSKKLGGGIT